MYTSFKKAKSISKLSSEQGFSLVEVLVVLAIFGIIAAFAAPNMSRSIANQKINNAASILRAALEEARIESVIRRQDVTVTLKDNVLTVKDSDSEISSHQIESSIQITAKASGKTDSFVFEPTKRLANGEVTFTICSNDVANEFPRQVVASAITNITTKDSGNCP